MQYTHYVFRKQTPNTPTTPAHTHLHTHMKANKAIMRVKVEPFHILYTVDHDVVEGIKYEGWLV